MNRPMPPRPPTTIYEASGKSFADVPVLFSRTCRHLLDKEFVRGVTGIYRDHIVWMWHDDDLTKMLSCLHRTENPLHLRDGLDSDGFDGSDVALRHKLRNLFHNFSLG